MTTLALAFGACVYVAAAAASPINLTCAAGGTAAPELHVLNATLSDCANWCKNQTACVGFAANVPYPASCNDTAAVLECHFKDSWSARRRGGSTAWSYWTVPGPRPKPPPKPYDTPPNPCGANITDQPKFHIMNLGIGPHDLNSILHWKGAWHIMHQANCKYTGTLPHLCMTVLRWLIPALTALTGTDWAHLVSTDFIHWSRLPSVLSPNGDWDGALTVLDGMPIILFDCFNVADCRPPPSGNRTALLEQRAGVGDPPIVGVARPVDPSDPNLTKWEKDPANPIQISGGHGAYAGPSTIWKANGKYNMVMSNGHGTARYESTDATLHHWAVGDPVFYPTNSGPSEFFPIPVTAPGTAAAAGSAGVLTHVLAGIMPPKPYRGGTPWYTLGHLDNATQKFTQTTMPTALDYSDILIFTQLHSDDHRLLFVGWWNVGLSCLTAPREVTFDATLQRLRALPIAELAGLHEGSLGSHAAPTTVSPGAASAMALFTSAKSSTSFDLELEVALPSSAREPLAFGLALLASDVRNAEVVVGIAVGGAVGGLRRVNVTAGVPGTSRKSAAYNSSFSFNIPSTGTATSMAVRVLADRTLVELFVAGGLGVVTTPVLAPGKDPSRAGAFVFVAQSAAQSAAGDDDSAEAAAEGGGAVTVSSASAWEMGCGWAPGGYPGPGPGPPN